MAQVVVEGVEDRFDSRIVLIGLGDSRKNAIVDAIDG